MSVNLTINDKPISAQPGATILEAADQADIYIPRLCYHPGLGSSHGVQPVAKVHREGGPHENDGSGPAEGYPGCRLCLVEIEGRKGHFTACDTTIEKGMAVITQSETLGRKRQDHLVEILRDHPHACLLCAQQEGCSRTQCSANVAEDERCCPLLGNCELQKVAAFVGVKPEISKYVPRGLPVHDSEPFFIRDYNLCVACLRCVRACNDLRGLDTLGFVFNEGEAIVGPTKSQIYADSDCRFCGACVEVCPTGALTDRELLTGEAEREAVLVPCVKGCPAGLDIPRYISHIRQGEPARALAVIRERLPLPNVLGMVCFHPCEDHCRRGELNEPMAICDLKRFAAETGGETWTEQLEPNFKDDSGKAVAIVGAGPAGLSAAYYLRLAGHDVMVYEAELEVGGMLRYAIPDYRLPPEVVDLEFELFKEMGINFRCNTRVGKDISLAELRQEYDAVFLGTGACLSKRIPVEGSKLEGVLWGVDMLKQVKKGELNAIEGRVMVIGGGNVALDVARTALRLGTGEVRLACLESKTEMPAHDWEVDEASEEGIVMHPGWGPKRITGDEGSKGRVAAIELVKCASVFDDNGRFAPEFDDSTTRKIKTDTVILAIGQTAQLDYTRELDLATDQETLKLLNSQTSEPGIFAGGEVARGPSSVVEAVADGAAAAAAIDRQLGGDGDIYIPLVEKEVPDPKLAKTDNFAELNRMAAPVSPPAERVKGFGLIEQTYSPEQAEAEAARCLRCDLRLLIEPVTLPPEKWQELTAENVARVPATEGVVQLLDEQKQVIVIQGCQDMRELLEEKLEALDEDETNARFFDFQEDPMYSKRESELIQQYLQQHGRMPEGDGDDDEDDLF